MGISDMSSSVARCITAAALAGTMAACAPRADQPAGKAPAAPLLGRFVGVLPCADCSGIATDLRLYAEQPSGKPASYESNETYLGTRDGDRSFQRSGRWTIMRGSAADRDATIYQTAFDRPGELRNFLRVSDTELRLLDRDQREIKTPAPLSLHRVLEGPQREPVTLAESDSGRVTQVAPGQIVIIRLSSNRTTGYSWTLATPSGDLLTALGEPVYVPAGAPAGAVGSGGVEVWSFVPRQNGRQDLRFEYRRPWEKGVAPAKVLSYSLSTAAQ